MAITALYHGAKVDLSSIRTQIVRGDGMNADLRATTVQHHRGTNLICRVNNKV